VHQDISQSERDLLKLVAARIRTIRDSQRLTAKEIAKRAGLSARFMSSLEAGEANVSILKLARVAEALDVAVEDLLRSPKSSGCITVLGLRGAGKSTLGSSLADDLALPFVELDARIESLAGISRAEIFSLHGDAYYRELEVKALREAFGEHQPMVIAVSGGIITNREAFERCIDETLCVWLQATPEAHLARVRAQGDERPMADRQDAMADLKRLLAQREPLYRRAHIHLDTTRSTPAGCLRELKTRLIQTGWQAATTPTLAPPTAAH
jgi:XRE family aerobic/anaerobic benzoate catabolism transcriptional regulator